MDDELLSPLPFTMPLGLQRRSRMFYLEDLSKYHGLTKREAQELERYYRRYSTPPQDRIKIKYKTRRNKLDK